jgi:hypothetical protein
MHFTKQVGCLSLRMLRTLLASQQPTHPEVADPGSIPVPTLTGSLMLTPSNLRRLVPFQKNVGWVGGKHNPFDSVPNFHATHLDVPTCLDGADGTDERPSAASSRGDGGAFFCLVNMDFLVLGRPPKLFCGGFWGMGETLGGVIPCMGKPSKVARRI